MYKCLANLKISSLDLYYCKKLVILKIYMKKQTIGFKRQLNILGVCLKEYDCVSSIVHMRDLWPTGGGLESHWQHSFVYLIKTINIFPA